MIHRLRPKYASPSLLLSLAALFPAPAQTAAPSITAVTPLSSEDIAHPCLYELLPLSSTPVRGIFVLFDRSADTRRLYGSPALIAFAHRHHLALLMPRHCASRTSEDISFDPASGLGRALFTALDQLSTQTAHPELRSAPLILLGFSGAGAFVARFVSFAPGRIVVAILSHPGQSHPNNLDAVNLSAAALQVPQLVLIGGQDQVVGTELPSAYVARHLTRGAPWLLAEQNAADHCCTTDATPLILAWIDSILPARLPLTPGPLRPMVQSTGYRASFHSTPTTTLDSGHLPTSTATGLTFTSHLPLPAQSTAGWLPSRQAALAWQRFAATPPHTFAPQ